MSGWLDEDREVCWLAAGGQEDPGMTLGDQCPYADGRVGAGEEESRVEVHVVGKLRQVPVLLLAESKAAFEELYRAENGWLGLCNGYKGLGAGLELEAEVVLHWRGLVLDEVCICVMAAPAWGAGSGQKQGVAFEW
ncbi:hypothetical protein chiPu_0011092 [Chiloscyllium punctatum]|uniref:Uncharacterized protein n=1 Tax=Chiloscyllium punctatum TaxID=137246 RepID=A0A401SQE6_CHIPU|nr:hypothetical protein [Chiloscyllium punctatum]